jgi:hypothetical protein
MIDRRPPPAARWQNYVFAGAAMLVLTVSLPDGAETALALISRSEALSARGQPNFLTTRADVRAVIREVNVIRRKNH